MKAVEISSFGGPDVPASGRPPAPVAGAGEVLIRVAASGVNRPDVLQRTGNYPVPPGASDIPGLEVAGVIESGDAQAMAAAGFQARRPRLCTGGRWWLRRGVRGTRGPVPAGSRRPGRLSRRRPCQRRFHGLEQCLRPARLQAGETLLMQGGSSGIGVTAIQMAMGERSGGPPIQVIVTAGSDDKCAACLKLGADHAINYRTQDFAEEAKRLTTGAGVNVILDMVAGATVARTGMPGRRRTARDHRRAGRHQERDQRRAGAAAPSPSPARRCVAAGGLQGRDRAGACARTSGH